MEWYTFSPQESTDTNYPECGKRFYSHNEPIGQVCTDIECPKCGKRIYMDNTMFLASWPVQYRYWCICGWQGYSFTKWKNKK